MLDYINNNHHYFTKKSCGHIGLRANNSFINNYNREMVNTYTHPIKSWAFKPLPQKSEDRVGEVYMKSFQETCYNSDSDDGKDKKDIKRCGVIMKTVGGMNELKFLVVRGRDGGIWSLPKGRINEDEEDEECAKRELYEETGIRLMELNSEKKCKMGKNYYFIKEVREEDYSSFCIHDRNEVDKVEWKTLSQLREVKCNKDIRSIMLYPEKKYQYHQIIFE